MCNKDTADKTTFVGVLKTDRSDITKNTNKCIKCCKICFLFV